MARVAANLVAGRPFSESTNNDDWLGHGIYFWEHGPQQAWSWAEERHGADDAAVVGALIRLGACLDLLDPPNASLVHRSREELEVALSARNMSLSNMNASKYLDCAVFNWLYLRLAKNGCFVESCRAVFVPLRSGRLPRFWERSGVFEGAHIQLCVREPKNILAVWRLKRDGRYGQDE